MDFYSNICLLVVNLIKDSHERWSKTVEYENMFNEKLSAVLFCFPVLGQYLN